MHILTLEPDGGKDEGRFASDNLGDFPQNLHACAQDGWPTLSLKGDLIAQDRAGSPFSGESKRLSPSPQGGKACCSHVPVRSSYNEREGPWLQQPLRAAWPREGLPRHRHADTCTCFVIFYLFLSSFSWKVSVSVSPNPQDCPLDLLGQLLRGLCLWLGTEDLQGQQ